jgi:hypothetical protein
MLATTLDTPVRIVPRTPYSPVLAPVAPRLGRAFAYAARFDIEALADLRRATVAFVARLKRDGLPPERVVLALKAALVKYGGPSVRPSLVQDNVSHAPGSPPTLYSVVFVWCLAAYFARDLQQPFDAPGLPGHHNNQRLSALATASAPSPVVATRRNAVPPSATLTPSLSTVFASMPTAIARAASPAVTPASTWLIDTVSASTSVRPSTAPLA